MNYTGTFIDINCFDDNIYSHGTMVRVQRYIDNSGSVFFKQIEVPKLDNKPLTLEEIQKKYYGDK